MKLKYKSKLFVRFNTKYKSKSWLKSQHESKAQLKLNINSKNLDLDYNILKNQKYESKKTCALI